MGTPLFPETIPSKLSDVLTNIIGSKLERLTRFSWYSTEEAISECGISDGDVFSLTAGPVLLFFDTGLALGASSNPELNSIVLWVERNEDGEAVDEPIETDDELFPIEAANQQKKWSSLLHQEIISFKIIHRASPSAKLKELPGEVGLLIKMSDGNEFILSHGLHDNSDDFSIIKNEQIDKDVLKELED